MEQWEVDLRAKLEDELPHGAYEIGAPPFYLVTGKQGYIESEVALIKAQKDLVIGYVISDQASDFPFNYAESDGATINDFKSMMDIFTDKNNSNGK